MSLPLAFNAQADMYLSYIISTNSLRASVVLRAHMLFFFLPIYVFFRYVPSAKECPLLLQLPNGEISLTNGFISPVGYHFLFYIPIFLDLFTVKF